MTEKGAIIEAREILSNIEDLLGVLATDHIFGPEGVSINWVDMVSDELPKVRQSLKRLEDEVINANKIIDATDCPFVPKQLPDTAKKCIQATILNEGLKGISDE